MSLLHCSALHALPPAIPSEHLCGGSCPSEGWMLGEIALPGGIFLPFCALPTQGEPGLAVGLTIPPQLGGGAGLNLAIKSKC